MIREQDLRIDIYRSGSVIGITDPWGVVVRITHIPSGLVATGRDMASGFKARDAAMKELEEKFADRFCPRHHDPDALVPFGFLRTSWWGPCSSCTAEEHQAWVKDVRRRLEFALAAAAHGMTVTWRPSEDTPEMLVARMMELNNAPATLAETLPWVRKYIRKEP